MPYPPKLTPELILREAQTLLDAGGQDALNMRPLAAALGVQASSLYRHFPDRAALLQALEDCASRDLTRAIEQASTGTTPRGALLLTCEAYVQYAETYPHRYRLLLSPRPPSVGQPGPGKDLWNTVLNLVSALSGHTDDTARTVALWAFLHGFVVMSRSGLFGLSGPKGGFEVGLSALLDEMERAATQGDVPRETL
ncbi:TetR/AcrR family transcriptional regulator [Deinococcus psychrotolerans]|uniref:TetR/AcrR family transcriptional regulator n=1 Tax=Deinococcus psychrotolerans TaxID=2489213 RepID=A0A3G8YLB9_9DEIO|nr:TetR/AcrR family transcriptional regulator [Deinococcus psychrotolerans]AZI43414.1 TetR/AcrR family transcriptional regulator [Deinococcus psychrotolerans]